MSEFDYLFDKKGEAAADVQRLEALLGRFAHGRRRPLRPRAGSEGKRWPWRWIVPAAAAAAAVAFVALRLVGGGGRGPGIDVVRTDGGRVAVDEWVEAKNEAQHLTMQSLGWLTLLPGGRLHVRRLDADQGRFYLDRGSLEAFVFAHVKARFFQVETAATTCIDLGCKYVLDVDPETKVAHVRVTMGQVAFTENDREVFVPRGAECRAVPGVGPGTPRFSDCAAVVREKLDAFDAAREIEHKRERAREVAAAATDKRDTLPLWHLLGHADGEVAAVARSALERLAGAPEAGSGLDAWRAHLDQHWW